MRKCVIKDLFPDSAPATKTGNPSDISTAPVSLFEDPEVYSVDLLADCIYAQLPGKSCFRPSKKPHQTAATSKPVKKDRKPSAVKETPGRSVQTSTRKQQLHNSIKVITGIPHSQSATTEITKAGLTVSDMVGAQVRFWLTFTVIIEGFA